MTIRNSFIFYSCIFNSTAETVEENFKYDKANKELKWAHAKLLNELGEMKAIKETVMNTGADIPQILSVPSTVISSLARKITTLSGSDNVPVASTSPILSQVLDTDTLDDSMRKVNKYVRKIGFVTLHSTI